MKFVYALIDPRSDEIFYVGQSSRGAYEPEWYIKSAHRGSTQRKVKAKLRQIHDAGRKAEWAVLEESDDLNAAECFWIASIRAAGGSLTNMTPGGRESGSQRHSDTGKNISKAVKGKPRPNTRKQEVRPMVTCACCDREFQTYLRPSDRIKGKNKFFCSNDCRIQRYAHGVG